MIKRFGGRILALLPFIIIQVLIIYLLFSYLAPYSASITAFLNIFGVILSIVIISKQDVASYKQAWLFIILLIPIVGTVAYVLFGNKKTGNRLKRSIDKSKKELKYSFPESNYVFKAKPKYHELRVAETLGFGWKMTGMETYKNANTKYYPLGDYVVRDLLNDLKLAKKYIFIEYFIIEEGILWNSIVDILKQKVQEGVDVRVIYDDLGSIGTFSRENVKLLIQKGIKLMAFNPVKYLTLKVNNRDHRKMTVIDGKIVYSGGINIADEYINAKKVYGHWKDIAFRVEGDAVIPYLYMFAEFWNAFSRDKIPGAYLPKTCTDNGENGYIFTYYDSPVREEHVCNTLNIEFLSQATKYIWFYTPYLMLDSSLSDALIRAARRGVDVRIIMPGIPDKKIVYRTSRSYYGPLLKAGVRIFEYIPGFLHAKAMICDDELAVIGTSNLDYRSLFLHFECNSVFLGTDIIPDIKKDFTETVLQCRERKPGDKLPGTRFGIIEALLRLIAPLL